LIKQQDKAKKKDTGLFRDLTIEMNSETAMSDGFFALRPKANVHKTPCERNCAQTQSFCFGGVSHGIRKEENKRSFQSVVSQLIKNDSCPPSASWPSACFMSFKAIMILLVKGSQILRLSKGER